MRRNSKERNMREERRSKQKKNCQRERGRAEDTTKLETNQNPKNERKGKSE